MTTFAIILVIAALLASWIVRTMADAVYRADDEMDEEL